MNFKQLAQLEPRLAAIETAIRQLRDDRRNRSFCANAHWYGPDGFKARLSQLVGWNAAVNTPLRSPEAYDVAYEHLYGLLPGCRNCLCG